MSFRQAFVVCVFSQVPIYRCRTVLERVVCNPLTCCAGGNRASCAARAVRSLRPQQQDR